MSTNLNYTIESSDLVYNVTDAEGVSTQVIYNLGDMAWGEHPFLYYPWIMLTYSHNRHGTRMAHDTRSGSVLLRLAPTKERLVDDLPLFGGYRGRILPMVLLGLLFGLLGWCQPVSIKRLFDCRCRRYIN